MLLLLDRNFMIELLEKKFWIIYKLILLIEELSLFQGILWWGWSRTVFTFKACVNKSLVLSQGCKLVIKVITIELCLDWIFTKTLNIFFKFRIIYIFPFFTDILLIKIILHRWDKWSTYLPFIQILEREITKPRMILNFFWSIES